MVKKIIHTFFSEEFFYGSHKVIDFIKFILANFWKWENLFLKIKISVKLILATFHKANISQKRKEKD